MARTMFSQFRVEKRCARCKTVPRNGEYCCKASKALNQTTPMRGPPPTVDLRLPKNIPNSTLLEHIATSYFFHHYVSREASFYRLELDSLSAIIEDANMRRKLSEIIIALGVLTLPNQTPSSVLAARWRYTKALRLTNKALADPSSAKTDEALLAVILLGLYETTPDESHSAASWNTHLDGARMLLQLQGLERLGHGPAFKMFSMLRLQIILHCFMTMQPVPPDLLELSAQLSETQGPDEKAVGRLVNLMARLCSLLNVDRGSTSEFQRSYVIMEAGNVDHDFAEWAAHLPSNYTPREDTRRRSHNTFRDTVYIYSSLYIAEVWSLYRSARVSLNGLIIKNCMALEAQHELAGVMDQMQSQSLSYGTSKKDRSMLVIQHMRKGICDTIPFLIGIHEDQSCRLSTVPLHSRTLVIHTIFFLIQTGSTDDEMTLWASSLLAEMQDDAGLDKGAIWMNSSHTTDAMKTLSI